MGKSGTLAQRLQLNNPKKLQHKSQKQKILQSNTKRLQAMLFHNSDILDSGMTMIEANIKHLDNIMLKINDLIVLSINFHG